MNSYKFHEVIDDSRLDSYLLVLELIKRQAQVEFDFRSTSFIAPAGMALLCCLVDAALERKRSLRFHLGKKLARQYPFVVQLKMIAENNR